MTEKKSYKYISYLTQDKKNPKRTAITAPPAYLLVHVEIILEPSVLSMNHRLRPRVKLSEFLSKVYGTQVLVSKFYGRTPSYVDKEHQQIIN